MTTKALQRVAVRMLYDESFLERVYADVATATGDCALTDDERAWLTVPDRRAWKVDPLRRSRSLAALVEEFAVSVAFFVRTDPAATARLDSFFSSRVFHDGMQAGSSLAQIFADWFVDQSIYRDTVRLEAALARVRRSREAGAGLTLDSGLCLAPAVEVLTLAGQTTASFGAILGILRQGSIVERALDRNLDIPLPTPGEPEGVLVDGRSADPKLEVLSAELAGVLANASDPISWVEFVAQAAAHGADVTDCRSIAGSFTEDGLLVQA